MFLVNFLPQSASSQAKLCGECKKLNKPANKSIMSLCRERNVNFSHESGLRPGQGQGATDFPLSPPTVPSNYFKCAVNAAKRKLTRQTVGSYPGGRRPAERRWSAGVAIPASQSRERTCIINSAHKFKTLPLRQMGGTGGGRVVSKGARVSLWNYKLYPFEARVSNGDWLFDVARQSETMRPRTTLNKLKTWMIVANGKRSPDARQVCRHCGESSEMGLPWQVALKTNSDEGELFQMLPIQIKQLSDN